MKASDVMTTTVVTIPEDATVEEAAKLLLRHGISAVPVTNAEGRLVGIVSEGDLVRRAETGAEVERSWWLELLTSSRTLAKEYVKAHSHKVADVMTRDPITATPDTPLGEIALLLEQHGIKRVPILDQDKIVGIVSRANLVQGLASAAGKVEAKAPADDAAIREAVIQKVKAAPWRPWAWNVTVHDGVAHLWGIANSSEERTAVGLAVESVPGVKEVRNNLFVRPRNWAHAAKLYGDQLRG